MMSLIQKTSPVLSLMEVQSPGPNFLAEDQITNPNVRFINVLVTKKVVTNALVTNVLVTNVLVTNVRPPRNSFSAK